MSLLLEIRKVSKQEQTSEEITSVDVVEQIISDVGKSEYDMCYDTSKRVYEMLRGEEIESVTSENSTDLMLKISPISSDTVDLIFNIEITISCGPYDENQKQQILTKHNIKRQGIFKFIFAKNKLRIFMHAFNIIIRKGNIIVSQSWFKCQKYKKIAVFDDFVSYNMYFVTKLLYAIKKYKDDPSLLYDIFNKQITEDDKKIFQVIKDLNKPIDYKFSISVANLSIKTEQTDQIPNKMTEQMRKEILYTEVQKKVLKVDNFTYHYNVITDSYLKGGAKTRGLQFFFDLKNSGYSEVSFPAFSDGYGQVAVAYASMLVGMKATIFINKKIINGVYSRTTETEKAIQFGANVIELSNPDESYVKSKILEQKAKEYAEKDKNIRYLNFGLFEEGYIIRFSETLSEVRKIYHLKPSEIWTASGTGTLANAISRAFPGIKINVVLTGFKIWKENVQSIQKTSGNKLKMYQFKSGTRMEKPPYQAHGTIDYKIWYFASRYMQNNALIWNVA